MKFVIAFVDSSYGYVRAAVSLLLGLFFIIWPETVANTIVILIGTLLIVSGIVIGVIAFRGNEEQGNKNSVMLVMAIINALFGLALLVFTSVFTGVIMYLFAALLLLFGVSQIINILRISKTSPLPWFFYIVPVALIAFGIVIFIYPTIPFIFFGLALVIYGVAELMSTLKIQQVLKNERKMLNL